MTIEDQRETIAFLASAAFDADHGDVETMSTHISVILLSGDRAIKLKRAVKLPYVDFSTPARRLAACLTELALNRRTAPSLYRSVRRVTREGDGRLALDGEGALVDAVVEMNRFDQTGLFDRIATAGGLTAPLMERLSHRIAAFHAGAAIAGNRSGAGCMDAVLDINERALQTTNVFGADEVARFNAAFRRKFAGLSPLLDSRARDGKVRRCHGDLHLRNICLVDGEPTLFDSLEFDEALATTDILYDLAFLLMDLWHRGLEELANLVLNRYLDELNEEDGLPLLPFLMAVRAAVRAHVTATQVTGAGPAAAALRSEGRAYFDLALALLEPKAAWMVAVGGLSGSGKSTVAAAIAPLVGPPPGARILASDRVRKRLWGVASETRLPQEAYRPDVSREVYAQVADRAQAMSAGRHGVVIDAVFDRPVERANIARVAATSGVAFLGLWLSAHPDVLVRRVASRRGGPSDATEDVVREQISRAQAEVEWSPVSADAGIAAVCNSAKQAVRSAEARIAPADTTGRRRSSITNDAGRI